MRCVVSGCDNPTVSPTDLCVVHTPIYSALDGNDPVNHPAHYNQGTIEAITYIKDQNLGFCLGNALKYIVRAEHKGNKKEDLRKAIWYIQYEIDHS